MRTYFSIAVALMLVVVGGCSSNSTTQSAANNANEPVPPEVSGDPASALPKR